MSARKTVQEDFAGEQTDAEATAETVQAAEAIATGKPATSTRPKADQPFDPIQYLSNFNGKDYLEVKWRVMWLRHEHPDARMTTEIVQHNEEGGFALFNPIIVNRCAGIGLAAWAAGRVLCQPHLRFFSVNSAVTGKAVQSGHSCAAVTHHRPPFRAGREQSQFPVRRE
jgi:hypothetical protein